MLEKIREGSQGVLAKVILGTVILTFALAGIGSYLGNTSALPAATVNGEEISQVDFKQKFDSNKARMQQQFGELYEQLIADESYLQGMRESVLVQLICEQLQTQLAADIGLNISDEKIIEIIRDMPEFQIAGHFDNDRYRAVLRQVGFQASSFRDYLKVENTRRQLSQAIIGSDFSLGSEVQQHAKLDQQTRDIEYIVFKQADYTDQVSLSDEDKKAYYNAHLDNYRTQEKISLQYVELKISDLMKEVAVSDEQLLSFYNDNINSYRTAVARRRVSHILFEFGDDEAAAQAKAQAVLAKLNNGEDFATLAKAESADAFSAENGGDLDWSELNTSGDDLFDEAVNELVNVNDVSQVVRSESGFHIIKLTGDEPEAIKSFDVVKQQVADEYKREQAMEVFAEKQTELADLAYEMPDTLEDAAEGIGATVKETALFSMDSAPPVVNFPAVISAAFSEDVLVDNLNSKMLEINPDHVMVVRLLKHLPARIRTEEEVASQIVTALTAEKAQQLAAEAAEQLLAKLSRDSQLSGQEAVQGLTVESKADVARVTSDVDGALRTELFKMPHPEQDKITVKVVKMGNGDQAVVALSAVKPGVVPQDLTAMQTRLASQRSQAVYRYFLDALKEGAKIEKMAVTESVTP